MNYNQFKKVRIIVAMITAIVMSFAVALESWVLAIADVLIAVAVVFIAKKQVREVLADERDYHIAGKAARYAQTVFCIAGAILAFYFMTLSKNTNAQAIGAVLGYSVCSLLLLNSAIAIYFQKNEK